MQYLNYSTKEENLQENGQAYADKNSRDLFAFCDILLIYKSNKRTWYRSSHRKIKITGRSTKANSRGNRPGPRHDYKVRNLHTFLLIIMIIIR